MMTIKVSDRKDQTIGGILPTDKIHINVQSKITGGRLSTPISSACNHPQSEIIYLTGGLLFKGQFYCEKCNTFIKLEDITRKKRG